MEMAADASFVQDLTESLGWVDVVKPTLLKAIEYRKTLVVDKLMGGVNSTNTPEQLAAQVYGLQYTINIIEKILKEGHSALEALRTEEYQQLV